MFLRARLSKTELDFLLTEILGRHHIPLHNRFIQSLMHNARANELPPMNLPIDVVLAIHTTLSVHPIPAPAAPVPPLTALLQSTTPALPALFPLTARTQPRRRVIPLPPYAATTDRTGKQQLTRITFRPRTAPNVNPNLPANAVSVYARSRRAAKFGSAGGWMAGESDLKHSKSQTFQKPKSGGSAFGSSGSGLTPTASSQNRKLGSKGDDSVSRGML